MRKSDSAAYAISVATGMVLWFAAMASSGKREPWDDPTYWSVIYPAAIIVSGLLGFFFQQALMALAPGIVLRAVPRNDHPRWRTRQPVASRFAGVSRYVCTRYCPSETRRVAQWPDFSLPTLTPRSSGTRRKRRAPELERWASFNQSTERRRTKWLHTDD